MYIAVKRVCTHKHRFSFSPTFSPILGEKSKWKIFFPRAIRIYWGLNTATLVIFFFSFFFGKKNLFPQFYILLLRRKKWLFFLFIKSCRLKMNNIEKYIWFLKRNFPYLIKIFLKVQFRCVGEKTFLWIKFTSRNSGLEKKKCKLILNVFWKVKFTFFCLELINDIPPSVWLLFNSNSIFSFFFFITWQKLKSFYAL